MTPNDFDEGRDLGAFYLTARDEFRMLREQLLRILEGAQAFRHDRKDWHQFEMEELLRAINWIRAQQNKDPVPMRKLLKKERLASGHTDYTTKLILYATELVLDLGNEP